MSTDMPGAGFFQQDMVRVIFDLDVVSTSSASFLPDAEEGHNRRE